MPSPTHYIELISPFPVPIFISQIDISILPQPSTPKNFEVPFMKPMKTTIGHWHCFHCGWEIGQLSLPSVFSGLPETSLLKTGSWLSPLVKPERFPLESELCASCLSSTETRVICQVSLVGRQGGTLALVGSKQLLVLKENREFCFLGVYTKFLCWECKGQIWSVLL